MPKQQHSIRQNIRRRLGNNVGELRVNFMTLIAIVLMAISAGFVGGVVGGRGEQQRGTSLEQRQQVVLQESELISEVVSDVGPSVVSVNVTAQAQGQSFFGFGSETFTRQSAGTGFIISDDGVVVTNRHVIPPGSPTITVTLDDGTELTDVEVIGRTGQNDPLDIAFLRIRNAQGKELKPVRIGDSNDVRVGDRVIAIGNALGRFQNTVTSGIISGFGRDLTAGMSGETLQNLFQTDAAINQGNSGGPLVNIQGEVIGINTAIAGGQAEGIGFAIPVDDVKGLIASVLDSGELQRPYIGVRYVSLTDDLAFQFGTDVNRGAFITPSSPGQPSILPNSPASKAGLQERDVIVRIDGDEINERNSLISLISRRKVGDTVELTVNRDGDERKIELRLEALPE